MDIRLQLWFSQPQQAAQRQMTQTIQIPASMAGHQLMAVQMPDGRQQIFALQGNQTLQMFNTPAGLQQVVAPLVSLI